MATITLERLRQKSHQVVRLPAPAQQVLDGYLHLRVEDAEAACPYHINPGLHAANRASLGKGRPEEIEALAAKYFKLYAMHPKGDPAALRTFLLACGIGIDCSGFAAWILNGITKTTLGRPIWRCLQFPGLRRTAVSKLRPIENISANLLTGYLNAQAITDLTQVKPGDLLRVASWHHVVIITEVGLDKTGAAHYFCYAQSSCMYGQEGGARTGYAVISKPRGSLLEQTWFDNYESNIIKSVIAEGGDESRLVRLKALA